MIPFKLAKEKAYLFESGEQQTVIYTRLFDVDIKITVYFVTCSHTGLGMFVIQIKPAYSNMPSLSPIYPCTYLGLDLINETDWDKVTPCDTCKRIGDRVECGRPVRLGGDQLARPRQKLSSRAASPCSSLPMNLPDLDFNENVIQMKDIMDRGYKTDDDEYGLRMNLTNAKESSVDSPLYNLGYQLQQSPSPTNYMVDNSMKPMKYGPRRAILNASDIDGSDDDDDTVSSSSSPYNSAKVAVEYFANRFLNSLRRTSETPSAADHYTKGGTVEEPTITSDQSNHNQSNKKDSGRSSGKRKADDHDPDGDGDREGNGQRKKRPEHTSSSNVEDEDKPFLACPYFKGQPWLHIGCALHYSPDLKKLKSDHLKRKHGRQEECTKCNRWFGDKGQLNEHQRSKNDCSSRPVQKRNKQELPDGIKDAMSWDQVFLTIYPDWQGELPSQNFDFAALLKYKCDIPALIPTLRSIARLCEFERFTFLQYIIDTLTSGGDEGISEAVSVLQRCLESLSQFSRPPVNIYNGGTPRPGQVSNISAPFISIFPSPDENASCRPGVELTPSARLDSSMENPINITSLARGDRSMRMSHSLRQNYPQLGADDISSPSFQATPASGNNNLNMSGSLVEIYIRPSTYNGKLILQRTLKLTEDDVRNWETILDFLAKPKNYGPLMKSQGFRGFLYKSREEGTLTITNQLDLNAALKIYLDSGEKLMKLDLLRVDDSNSPKNDSEESGSQNADFAAADTNLLTPITPQWDLSNIQNNQLDFEEDSLFDFRAGASDMSFDEFNLSSLSYMTVTHT